ncbi:Hpt domain-containing protein [Thiopseudomonas alkaliphila]|uniref:Chemotaxis protein CheA n=1 Tax=Thiopseudomonas alkaliphila TaxID=1697053 RepID=A0AAW7DSI8_9GAMM|nr:Hpt domain-containing protein [Thiopseudomonas alkaliphila]MDM1696794.1 Hpt domain-containing protein [Thiopseudomonas alkaliphila]
MSDMIMGDHREFIALHWVKDEITETLRQATESLQVYITNPEDTAALQRCLSFVHQVYGTLHIVELAGAALLAEEIEILVHRLIQQKIRNPQLAVSVLMHTLSQFPLYLDNLQEQEQDPLLKLLSLLNDLRAVQQEAFFTENHFFFPDLNALPNAQPEAQLSKLKTQDNDALLNKLQKLLTEALHHLVQDTEHTAEQLHQLLKIYARLEAMSQQTPQVVVWQSASALTESLLAQCIPLSPAVLTLLLQTRPFLQTLTKEGWLALNQPAPTAFLKNALFYIYLSDLDTECNRQLRQQFKLSESLNLNALTNRSEHKQTPQLAKHNLMPVIAAVLEELIELQQSLQTTTSLAAIHEQAYRCRQIADSLALVGNHALRKIMLEQAQQLEALKDYDKPTLLNVSGACLYVSSTLSASQPLSALETSDYPATVLSQNQQRMLQAARAELEQAKEGIIQFISSQWSRTHLQSTISCLNKLSSTLYSLNLLAAAKILDNSRNYIQQQLLAKDTPPLWTDLDAFADIIASVDYYLEGLQQNSSHPNQHALTAAIRGLITLGYPADLQLPIPAQDPLIQLTSPGTVDSTRPIYSSFDNELASSFTSSNSTVDEQSKYSPLITNYSSSRFTAASSSMEQRFSDNAYNQLNTMDLTPQMINPPAAETPKHLLPPPADEEPVDLELQEVFTEEAEEVLETIQMHFPTWQQNLENTIALKELRRAFHTLKGSGRMVRALIIGELAWAIENMLNRVIDQTLTPSNKIIQLLEQVIEVLPTLVQEYAQQQQRQSFAVDCLAATAHALANNQPVPDFVAPNSDTDTTEVVEEVLDKTLLEIFRQEAQGHLQSLYEFIQNSAELLPREIPDALQRTLHTLKGSAAMANIYPILQLATPLERLAKEYKAHLLKVHEQDLELLKISAKLIQSGLEQLSTTPLKSLPGADNVIIAINLRIDSAIRNKKLLAAKESQSTTNQKSISNFLATCSDLLFNSEELLLQWKSNPEPNLIPLELLEDLQALSQNAQNAKLFAMQHLADALHDLYHAIQQEKLTATPEFFGLAEKSHEALMNMMDEFMAGLEVTAQPEAIATLQKFIQQNKSDAVVANTLAKPLVPNNENNIFAVDYTDAVLDIFLEEALELIENAGAQLERWQTQPEDQDTLRELMRELHTLKGGAAMAGLFPITDLAHELESLYEGLLAHLYQPSDELFSQLQTGHDTLASLIDQLYQRQPLSIPTQLTERLANYRHKGRTAPTSAATENVEASIAQSEKAQVSSYNNNRRLLNEHTALALFIAKGDEILQSTAVNLANWELNQSATEELDKLQQNFDALKSSAVMAEVTSVAELSQELALIYADLKHAKITVTSELYNLLHDGQNTLQALINRVREHKPLASIEDLMARIQTYRTQDAATKTPTESKAINIPDSFMQQALQHFQTLHALLEQETQEQLSLATRNHLLVCLQELKSDAKQAKVTIIHNPLKDAQSALLTESKPLTRLIMAQLLDAIQRVLDPNLTPVQLKEITRPSTETITLASSQLATPNRAVLPFEKQKKASIKTKPQPPTEQVRVSSEHLEELVNLAGETSIFRGRVEQQVSDFSFTLSEMEATIDRVRDQLRRLDTETQAQILSRYQIDVEQGYEDFDPLEMDRHSQMQQLSQALFESASDLLDLKETLANRIRDTETLLLQQSRVNTELQEGLMRTRMVTFDRLLPRLRRIVRQVSAELGKQAELTVSNAEGEVDRTMLERMIAPLEHMLRNALDHGIESPDQRRLAGKPEVGQIHLELAREGADVLLILKDDGDGVNIEAVKEKAIERGWMKQDAPISDQDAAQFILRSGLTTANTLSQISGRGVGMDAVNTQIKQMGGHLEIETQRHKGSKFTIRLPFTVSINRALMTYSGDDLYAIPLNTIEGITRISNLELQQLYQQQQQDGKPAIYRYADQDYQLTYIGTLLNSRQQPKLLGDENTSLPLILLRSADYAVAVQVDALASSREIVVKSLGPQFANVPGISGATILGDGRVVIILDLMATVREKLANGRLLLPEFIAEHPTLADKPHIMVIDDSITVRKVTSRLLERNDMEVSTAKDGVDAISQLQDKIPDLMLLDIEMPRMDGFEVAKLVRHDERLKHIPIVMITSRTGDKHRERALSLGVNEYLGKPYQEEQLLAVIQHLLIN